MAVTTEMKSQVATLYVALFGRAPDAQGLAFWAGRLDEGQSLQSVIATMLATEPARAYYPQLSGGALATAEAMASFLTTFYRNVLGREPDAGGLAYWTAQLSAGRPVAAVVGDILGTIEHYVAPADPALAALGSASRTLLANKVQVALHYADKGGSIADATRVLNGVTTDPVTVRNALTNIDSGNPGLGGGAPSTGGGDPPPAAFSVAVAAGAVTFGGTATGAITVTTDGTALTFSRAGHEATIQPAIASLAAGGIPAAAGGLSMTAAVFATAGLAAKFADGAASVDATGATSAQVDALVAGAAKLAANGVTGTINAGALLSVADFNALATAIDAAATVTVADTGASIKALAGAAVNARLDLVDATDNALTLTLAELGNLTNARLAAADDVTVSLSAGQTLASRLNVDKVNLGVAALAGAAQAAAGDVDAAGEWHFGAGTLTYFDGAVVSVALTGVGSISAMNAGVATLGPALASNLTATSTTVGATSNAAGTLGLYDGAGALVGSTVAFTSPGGLTQTLAVSEQAAVSNLTLKVADGSGAFAVLTHSVILGTAGNDAITGTAGADFIYGLSGSDTLTGGAGADKLFGGGGDTFVDFEGQDTLDGTGANTLRLTATSADLNAAANAQLVNVTQVTATTASAGVTVDLSAQSEAFTVTGSAFADTLRGGTGNDVLNGGDGDDTFRAASGADTIDGGNGTDTLLVQAGAANLSGHTLSNIETLDLNAQTTTLSQAQHAGFNTFSNAGSGGVIFSDAGAVTAAAAGLSRYTLANGANTFTANGAQNYNVSGAAASAKQTFNFAGANFSASDTIVGGSGTDDVLNITGNTGFTGFVLDGVNKVENIVFDNTTSSISLNRAGSSALTSTSGVVTIDASSMTTGNFTFSDNASTSQAFKILLGGTGNATITISGNESVTIVGGAGFGSFNTNAGTDSITGGTGNDTVRGGVGADLIDLSRGGNDVWRFVLADGGDTVNGFTAGTGANHDTIDWSGELRSNNGSAVDLAGVGVTKPITASNFLVLDGAASAGGVLTIANATGYTAATSTVLVVQSSVATLSGHTVTAFRNAFGAGGTHALTAGVNDDSKFLVMVYDGTTASANAVLFHVDFTAATNSTNTLEAGDTVTLLGVLNGVGADTIVAGNFG